MNQKTWKITAVSGLALVLALLWWSARRQGDVAAGEEGAAAAASPGVDVAALAERARLQPIELRAAGRAAIAGHVRDPGGQAIAGATVCAGSGSWQLSGKEREARACTTSASDGGYRIEGLVPVPHFVHASAPGFIPGAHQIGAGTRAREQVLLRANQEAREVDVILEPGGVQVDGVVRDLSGGVLEGAELTAGYAFARTGPEGTFTLWVAPGRTFLEARAEGYASGWMDGFAPGEKFEIALTPESVLIGRVVRAGSGEPVANAKVSAAVATAMAADAGPVFTDADGHFRLDGLKPGAYKATAYHEEAYGVAAESVVLGLGETSAPLVIEAHPATLVEGTVVVEGGSGCDDGWVHLVNKSGPSVGGRIEADGVAKAIGVLAGTYEVQVHCPQGIPAASYPPVVGETTPVRGLRWQVAAGQTIRGRVTTATNRPVPRVNVRAEPVPDPSQPHVQATSGWSAPTDGKGQFDVPALLPGRYRLIVGSNEHPPSDTPVEVTLPKGQDLEDIVIALPATGEIRGSVLDSEGRAVRGVEVVLRGERAAGLSTRTIDDGSFRLARVPAGEYQVLATSAWQPLQAPGTSDDDLQGTPVSLSAGETREVKIVVKSQHGRITGRVVDGTGGPLSDAFVEATRERDSAGAAAGGTLRDSRWSSGAFGSDTRKLTDQDGRFELSGLAEGKYTLVAQRRGGGEGTAEHVASGSDAVIKIADAASLAGSVRLTGGGSPPQFKVTLNAPKTGYRVTDEFFRTGGAFRFPELPAGDYNVIVEAPEGATTVKTTVREGSRGEVQVELAPRLTVRGKVIDAESGKPVPGMQVSLAASGQVQFFTAYDKPAAGEVTDAEGRFEIDRVPSGMVRATILPNGWVDNGYGWSSMTLQVTASGATTADVGALKIAHRRLTDNDSPGDLGFGLREAEPDAEPGTRKLIVAFVRPGGPAMQAGMLPGDEIVSVDGQDVSGPNAHLFQELAAVKAGTKLRVGLARGAIVEVTASKGK